MRLFAGGVRPGNRPKSNAAVDYQLTRDQGLAAARQIAVMALTAEPVILPMGLWECSRHRTGLLWGRSGLSKKYATQEDVTAVSKDRAIVAPKQMRWHTQQPTAPRHPATCYLRPRPGRALHYSRQSIPLGMGATLALLNQWLASHLPAWQRLAWQTMLTNQVDLLISVPGGGDSNGGNKQGGAFQSLLSPKIRKKMGTKTRAKPPEKDQTRLR